MYVWWVEGVLTKGMLIKGIFKGLLTRGCSRGGQVMSKVCGNHVCIVSN